MECDVVFLGQKRRAADFCLEDLSLFSFQLKFFPLYREQLRRKTLKKR
jgi:hypothetical protein